MDACDYGRAPLDGEQGNFSLIPWNKQRNTDQPELTREVLTPTALMNTASLGYISPKIYTLLFEDF